MGDLRKQSFKQLSDLIADVDDAVLRGNKWIDITGGEPLIYPDIEELVTYIHSKGLKVCVITNGLVTSAATELPADEYLVSVHGSADVHDQLVNRSGARLIQVQFLQWLKENKVPYRFNTVLSSGTDTDLMPMVMEFIEKGFIPLVWNFINFNPHYEWAQNASGTQGIAADLESVKIQLPSIIGLLEGRGCAVNLRYFPMCMIDPEFRRVICNDMHVSFDPYEWDYSIFPKTLEAHLKWAINGSNGVEMKSGPCGNCQLQWICGGVNKKFYEAYTALGHRLEPVTDFRGPDPFDFYYYRKENKLALEVRI
jgi:MoaA/NifB/PqqE/SkfB family radical SAM enzyme